MLKSKIKKINIPFLILSIIYFIITFFTDSRIVDFSDFHIVKYIFIKIVVFAILFVAFQYLALIFCKRDKDAKQYFKYFLWFFIPVFIILLLIWPGVWFGNDVKSFVNYAYHADFFVKLHYLTSLFYSVGLSIFPVLSGAIILQLIYMSVIFSYILKNMLDYFHHSKWCYLIGILFFLPVTVFYTLYANRPVLFGMTYLLMVAIALFDYINKRSFSWSKFLLLSFLLAITANWRAEANYLLLAGPLFIFLIYHVKLTRKNLCKILIPILICFLLVRFPQDYSSRKLTDLEKSKYNLPIYIGTLSWMMTDDLYGDHIEQDLAKVDQVLVLQSLKKYPSYNEIVCVMKKDSCIRKKYSMEAYHDLQKAYLNIILKNKSAYLNARYLTFLYSTRIINDQFSSINLYKNDDQMINNDPSTKVIFGNNVRQFVLSILEGRPSTTEEQNIIYRYTNNLFIPLFIVLLLFVVAILKRHLLLFLLTGMLLGHAVLVFLTAPASYFMYYYYLFLTGMFLGIFFLVKVLLIFQNRKRIRD